MTPNSRHITTWIDRPASEVYEFAANPANLPKWAAGLGSSVELVDGQWEAESPMGRVMITFAERNEYGILDHRVTLPSGQSVYNPMRVIPEQDGTCDVVFTLRQQPEMTDQDFDRDADAVAADLATLKQHLERPSVDRAGFHSLEAKRAGYAAGR